MPRPNQPERDRNRERSLHESRTMPEVCTAKPVKLTVGTTHKCNLTCPMCFKQYEPGHNMHYPSLGLARFERIAAACFPTAEEVVFTVSGEPLISESIEQELQISGRYGVDVCLTSNGTPLGVERLRRLVLENVSVLTLSLDGATAATFEKIRRGAKFDKVMHDIRLLTAEKRARGSRTRVVGHMTLMRANVHELPDWVRLMHDVGCDACTCEPVQAPATFHAMALESCPDLANRTFAAARAVAKQLGFPLSTPADLPVNAAEAASRHDGGAPPTFEELAERHAPEPPEPAPDAVVAEVLAADRSTIAHPRWQEVDENGPAQHAPIDCPYAWSRTWINYDGSVKPCCHPGFVHDLGNIDRDDFAAIWNGAPYRQLRRSLRSGHAPAPCRDCYLVGLYAGLGDVGRNR